MSYPERGATYKNRPAWLDRAVEGEKRADGGMTNSRLAQVDPDFEPSAAADARNSAAERIRSTRAMPKRKD
jgi:hypothetical protein